MKLVVYATDGEDRDYLEPAITEVGAAARWCDRWDDVITAIADDRPDVVVLGYQTLSSDGDGAARSAEFTLRSMQQPVALFLSASDAAKRFEIELQTEFEHFAVAPFDGDGFRAVLRATIGDSSTSGARDVFDEAEDTRPDATVLDDPPPADLSSAWSTLLSQTGETVQVDAVPDDEEGESDEQVREPAVTPVVASVAASVAASATASEQNDATRVDDATSTTERVAFDVLGPPAEDTPPPPGAARVFATQPPDATEEPDASADRAVAPTDRNSDEAERVHVALPDRRFGQISDVPVPRLLNALRVLRSTGELVLRHQTLERRIAVLDGQLGLVHEVPGESETTRLLSSFGWRDGEYMFYEREVPEARFHAFGRTLTLLETGTERHIGINEAATSLGPLLSRYPIGTDQANRGSGVQLATVDAFLDVADGTRSLESIISTAGADVQTMLRGAWLGWLTSMVVFRPQADSQPVVVSFVEPDELASVPDHGIRGAGLDSGAFGSVTSTLSAAESSGVSGAYAAVSDAEISGSGVSMPTAPVLDEKSIHDELQQTWSRWSAQDGYTILGLEPGCGPRAVNDAYYGMVRDIHPDRYARAKSPEIKALAEKIFMHVRQVQADLVKREKADPLAASGGSKRERVRAQRKSRDAVQSESPSPTVARPRSESPVPPPTSVAARLAASGIVSGATRRRRRRASSSGGQSTVERASSGASVRSGAQRPTRVGRPDVDEMLEQAKRVVEPEAADAPEKPTPNARAQSTGATSVTPSQRRLSPDQLFRNAKRALTIGAEQKALDILLFARRKGLDSEEANAFEAYLQYVTGRLDPETVLQQLEELRDALEEKPIELSQVQMLLGHVCRLEELYDQGIAYYADALNSDGQNDEAARWARHMKKRGPSERRSAGGSEAESFTDKLTKAVPTLAALFGNKK